jgi:hypothetical protein
MPVFARRYGSPSAEEIRLSVEEQAVDFHIFCVNQSWIQVSRLVHK